MSDLTYQQQVVFEQQQFALKTLWEANDKLDDKGNVLITGASIIVGLVAGTNFFISPSVSINGLSALIFAVFFLILVFASKLWSPQTMITPGPDDVDELYRSYISCELDDAYYQVVIDIANAVKKARIANNDKARWLSWMIWSLQAQMVLLIFALVWLMV